MKLVLIHGWGFHGGVWSELTTLLGDHEIDLIDLGFVRGGPRGAPAMAADAVYIGHSFGVLWALKHGVRPIRGLVSIAGFDCFFRYVPEDVIPAMLAGLKRDPLAQMRDFWRRCGVGEDGPGTAVDAAALRAGLRWLGEWDAEQERRALGAPTLALASRDDMIVREPMTEAIWGGGNAELHWLEDGGHMLPLTHASWCAEHIRSFIDDLDG